MLSNSGHSIVEETHISVDDEDLAKPVRAEDRMEGQISRLEVVVDGFAETHVLSLTVRLLKHLF